MMRLGRRCSWARRGMGRSSPWERSDRESLLSASGLNGSFTDLWTFVRYTVRSPTRPTDRLRSQRSRGSTQSRPRQKRKLHRASQQALVRVTFVPADPSVQSLRTLCRYHTSKDAYMLVYARREPPSDPSPTPGRSSRSPSVQVDPPKEVVEAIESVNVAHQNDCADWGAR